MLISVPLNSSFKDQLCKNTTGTCRISQVFQKVTIRAQTHNNSLSLLRKSRIGWIQQVHGLLAKVRQQSEHQTLTIKADMDEFEIDMKEMEARQS